MSVIDYLYNLINRHECKLSPSSVYKNFTSQEVEAGFAIMIRAGLDRDNFTDSHCLWDPIDSRPFDRVPMTLNRFKFLLRACVSITIVIDLQEKETID